MFFFRKPKHDPETCETATCEDAECKVHEAQQQVLAAAKERVKTNPPTTRAKQTAMRFVQEGGAALACALLLLGCSPGRGYVAADRATFDAIAGEYSVYVASDPKLGQDEKRNRQKNVESWEARLVQAEKGKGE